MAIVQATRTPGAIRLRFDVEGMEKPVFVELSSSAWLKGYVSGIPGFR